MNKEVRMADISVKSPTKRTAVAEGFIRVGKETLKMIKEDRIPKGNLMAVSKTAGISGAKLTPRILPLCHPVSITGCVVDLDTEENGVRVRVKVKAEDRTGVEMEAMTACTITLLNIYDMIKPIDKSAEIKDIKLIKKTGGKSGVYERNN